MSRKQLEEAFSLVEHNSDQADFDGPKSAGLLAKAEHALRLTFPPTYREFLARLGSGDIAGTEFYGVIGEDFENSSVPDAVWLTRTERRESKFPEKLIIVAATGDGAWYAIDCAKPSGVDEHPVVICGPDGGDAAVVAEDFGEFFFNAVRDAVSS
jgi:hypothetical protein